MEKTMLEPKTDREIILHVNNKVSNVEEKLDVLTVNLTKAVDRFTESIESLERNKLAVHESRIKLLEDWKTQQRGRDNFLRAVVFALGAIGTVAGIVFSILTLRK